MSVYDLKEMVEDSRRGYYKEKVAFFLKVLKNTPSTKKILDIGCNDGKLTKLYAAYGNSIGIDTNSEAIKQCKTRNLECLCCEIHELAASHAHAFDVIIAGDIIEHIFDTDAFLSTIYQLLKPSGSLLLTTPNLASLGRRIMLLGGINPFIEFSTQLPSISFNVGHVRYYTRKNLEEQLKFHGFKHIQVYGDKINITKNIHIPYLIAKHIPSLARNLMVHAST